MPEGAGRKHVEPVFSLRPPVLPQNVRWSLNGQIFEEGRQSGEDRQRGERDVASQQDRKDAVVLLIHVARSR